MTYSRHRAPVLVVAAIAVAGGLLSGCAYQQPVPAPAPAPRSLRIEAMRGQSQKQQDRDKRDCQDMASATATSSDGWARGFANCMTSRGYDVR